MFMYVDHRSSGWSSFPNLWIQEGDVTTGVSAFEAERTEEEEYQTTEMRPLYAGETIDIIIILLFAIAVRDKKKEISCCMKKKYP